MSSLSDRLRSTIRDVPDFPKPGILFKDITPLLADAALVRDITTELASRFRGQVTRVVGVESRGFIFGLPLALELGLPFSPARKPGKLPFHLISESYALEYGTAQLDLHTDAVAPGDKVLIVDDLLATGGTAGATARLVRRLGGEVAGFAFVVELGFLHGREALAGERIEALVSF